MSYKKSVLDRVMGVESGKRGTTVGDYFLILSPPTPSVEWEESDKCPVYAFSIQTEIPGAGKAGGKNVGDMHSDFLRPTCIGDVSTLHYKRGRRLC